MRGARGRLAVGSLAVALAVAALAAACGDEDEAPSDNGVAQGGGGELVVAEVARSAAEPAAGEAAAAAVDAFAADLYAELTAGGNDNLVFSPYSIAVALAMTRVGARGETAAEMEAVLHAEVAGDLDAGFNAIDQALAQRPGEFEFGEEPVELELSTANALWGQRGFAIKEPFLETLAAHYGAGLRTVDYVAALEEAVATINAWVSEQTRARIPELLKPGVIDSSTVLVLTNAIYLNAPWMFPFAEGQTADAPFELLEGDAVTVPFMALGAKLGYAAGEGYQAVELPYIGGELAMVVIVPDAGTFADFEAGLDGGTLTEVVGGLSEAQVDLRLPKWRFRTPSPLNEPLKALGMPTAFGAGADFRGIADADLFISAVVHEAFIAVDELGTEAAAATAVGVALSAAPQFVELRVDRPFLFAIRDRETGATLFLGRVLDPSAGG